MNAPAASRTIGGFVRSVPVRQVVKDPRTVQPRSTSLMPADSHPELETDDLYKAVHRVLDVFTEAAELDRERVQRWAQFHAVQAAFWGRRHGFRIARSEPRLHRLTEFADRLAELLTEHP